MMNLNVSGRAAPFCKLADLSRYVACPWDLTADPAGRAHWIEFFKRHLGTMLSLGVEAAAARGETRENASQRADRCRLEFIAAFDAFGAAADQFGRVTILTLDRWRDDILRRHGFVDPFIDLKNRENEKMLPLLATVCDQIDSLSGTEQFRAVVHGIFAGNIFDMGADATAKKFLHVSPDFFATRDTLPEHPWLIDDYAALAQRMLGGPLHKKAVFFIDNAGSDFLLGALPAIRWLARRGTPVVLAANSRPTLNDMTVDDVRAWWPRILQVEPSFGELPISIVGTGTGEPLIDLGQIDPQLNAAASDADLVILEGMGRGVESNLEAEFNCDTLNIAMLKDSAVAGRHGGKVFDLVCQFRAGKSPGA
ncbi:MAG: ARMT1-like domain-containing protein [Tepidisphaeraceae bacterium]|jgi:type II pantothenate kinase